MPRVYIYTTRKRRDGSNYTCSKCHKDILQGQKRYEWSFRYGGTYRRHVDCGYPRQSELTQSKMAEVYSATEDLEDQLQGNDWVLEDAENYVQEAAEAIREVANEYEEAAQNFGNAGENQERYEALDAYADEVENSLNGISGFETEEDREEVRSVVSDAISQCPY